MATRLAAELPRRVELVCFAARLAPGPQGRAATLGELPADARGTSGRWLLLSGSPQALRRLRREDFWLPESELVPAPLSPSAMSAETRAEAGLKAEDWPGVGDLLPFILVDRHGRRRGTYPGEAEAGMDAVGRLVEDARRLLGSWE